MLRASIEYLPPELPAVKQATTPELLTEAYAHVVRAFGDLTKAQLLPKKVLRPAIAAEGSERVYLRAWAKVRHHQAKRCAHHCKLRASRQRWRLAIAACACLQATERSQLEEAVGLLRKAWSFYNQVHPQTRRKGKRVAKRNAKLRRPIEAEARV